MNSANYISVSEFEAWNPELDFSNYTDVTVSGMIQRASANVDNFLQYSLGVEDIANEINEASISSDGNLILYTRKAPILSLSALSVKLGTVNFTLGLVDGNGNNRYDIPSRGSYVIYPYQEISMQGTFTIRNLYQLRGTQVFTKASYRAGYETIPNTVKDAVNLWTKDIFIRQANPMDLTATTQGSISMMFKNRAGISEDGSEDSKWVRDAKMLLQSYKKITF